VAARGFLGGFGMLLRGFAWWGRRPGTMALGLAPAAIVAVLLLAALVALGVSLPGLTSATTPFADAWPSFWAFVLRLAIGAAALGAALALAVVTFTALTLAAGEPFYDRIWRTVERDLGGPQPSDGAGFWRGVADSASLIARGLAVALLAGSLGLIPVVGGVVGLVTGLILTGWLLSDELVSRALGARGIRRRERRALLRRHRGLTLGFGVATQLCFLIPLGAILAMPAAVAGATLLARAVLPASPTPATSTTRETGPDRAGSGGVRDGAGPASRGTPRGRG